MKLSNDNFKYAVCQSLCCDWLWGSGGGRGRRGNGILNGSHSEWVCWRVGSLECRMDKKKKSVEETR